jgi:hypothetical protein
MAAAVLVAGLAGCAAPPPVRTGDRPPGPGAGDRGSASLPSSTGRAAAAPRPEDLAGRPPAWVRETLGAPSLTRREAPAEVWQYAGGDCVVDVFFYPPADGGAPAVAYLDSRDMTGGALPPADCLARLAAAAP